MRKLLLVLLFIAMSISPVYAGEAILTWTGPTLNTDGSDIDDLAGYVIYRGFENITGENYDIAINPVGLSLIPGAGITYINTGLTRGTYFYRVKSYNASGMYSDYSNEGKKNVVTTPEATTDLIVQ